MQSLSYMMLKALIASSLVFSWKALAITSLRCSNMNLGLLLLGDLGGRNLSSKDIAALEWWTRVKQSFQFPGQHSKHKWGKYSEWWGLTVHVERGKEQNEAVINHVVAFCTPPQIIYHSMHVPTLQLCYQISLIFGGWNMLEFGRERASRACRGFLDLLLGGALRPLCPRNHLRNHVWKHTSNKTVRKWQNTSPITPNEY